MVNPLELTVLPEPLAICRLGRDEKFPSWADGGKFCSFTRTQDELSVVCAASFVPVGVHMEDGWRAFMITGPLGFELTGILAGLADVLARAGISIFAVSTFDTDYILVRENALAGSIAALKAAGHRVNVE